MIIRKKDANFIQNLLKKKIIESIEILFYFLENEILQK